MMEHRIIGSLTVSVVGLGCNSFGRFVDEARSVATVRAALEEGVDFFDTANVYVGVDGASEEHLRSALGSHRDEVAIATKFGKDPFGDEGRYGASPTAIRTAIEGSLRRLGTDRIDLYQLHEPDPSIPISETLGTLDELIAEGKVRELGHSGFTPTQMHEAAQASERGDTASFVATQTEWSLLERGAERDVVPSASELGISILPFWPLSSGLLTGKYGTGEHIEWPWRLSMVPNRTHFLTERRFRILGDLRTFAHEAGCTLLQLAVSWLISRQEISSVIAGATSPEQVRANVSAGGLSLTESDLERIDEITRPNDGVETAL